jgi:hypothetical protein
LRKVKSLDPSVEAEEADFIAACLGDSAQEEDIS